MRSALAVLAVVCFLVALNALFAGAAFTFGRACQWMAAECLDTPLVLVVGIAALAVTIAVARWGIISVGSGRRRRR